MDINNYDNFISDDDIMYEYENELYCHMYKDSNDFCYNQVYYTDASNHKNNIFSLENIKQNQTGKNTFYQISRL